jgi:ABC-type phosphate/phosphonate transport system ATPase subunit
MIFQEYALVERLTVMENLLSGRLGYTGFWASWFRRFQGDDIAQAYACWTAWAWAAWRTSAPMRSPAASASAWASPAR